MRALIEPGRAADHFLAGLSRCFRSWRAAPTAARCPSPAGSTHCSPRRTSTDPRVVALASPNDPTGELLRAAELARLLDALPEHVAVLLDEALIDFADAQPAEQLAARCSRRTRACSCSAPSPRPGAWPGCASATRSAARARRSCWPSSSPSSALDELAQTGALESLRSCSELVAAPRGASSPRSASAWPPSCACSASTSPDSQANFLWAAHPRSPAPSWRRALARAGVIVAAGDRRSASRSHAGHRARPPGLTSACSRRWPAPAGRLSGQSPVPDWRSSAPVVCSRILRQPLTCSRSSAKCLTTLRTRVREIAMPWRSATSLKLSYSPAS